MIQRFFVAAACVLTFGCSDRPERSERSERSDQEASGSVRSAITGGTIASRYPEAVLLRNPGGSKCTGAVISPYVVLTAGHCFVLPPVPAAGWEVKAPYAGGQTALSTGAVYWAYRPGSIDVGLLFLDRPIRLGMYPSLARTGLPRSPATPLVLLGRTQNGVSDDTNVFVSGTALTSTYYASSDDFYNVSGDLLQSGDSGGPVEIPASPTHTIVAVNSLGADPSSSTPTVVVARIDPIADWIQVQIASHGGGGAPPLDVPSVRSRTARSDGFSPRSGPSFFTAAAPSRIIDTRATGALPAGTSTWVVDAVPASAVAVVANPTVIGASAAGYATLQPPDARWDTSTLNFSAGAVSGHGTLAALTDRRFSLLSSASANWAIDVGGYFAASGAGFVPHPGARVLDTRGSGGRFVAGANRQLGFDPALVPSDATAVALNVTAVSPSTAGFLAVVPCGSAINTSNLNYVGGDVVDSQVIAPLYAGGLCIYSSAATDVLVDFTGSFRPAAGRGYVPIQPLRVADTRGGAGAWVGPLSKNQEIDIVLGALTGLAADAQAAFVNLTSADAKTPGFLTARPCGSTGPVTTSALNFKAGSASNGALVKLDPQRRLCITSSAATNVIVDLLGVF